MPSQSSIKRARFLGASAAAIGAAAVSPSFASAQSEVAATMGGAAKPSIVFCHGLWADGSCFSKVMGPLLAQGYDCIAVQYPLNTPENDVVFTKWAMDVVKGPIVLVGHSYGGTVITAAGTDPRVKALVYINALAPDAAAGETSQSIQQKFPGTACSSTSTLSTGASG
jgi:pimeloyl-ACP methyl ester carboxylesterase